MNAPIITHEGNGVVFSFEQAYAVFSHMPPGKLVLCVNVPYCKWVGCAKDAKDFFETDRDAPGSDRHDAGR